MLSGRIFFYAIGAGAVDFHRPIRVIVRDAFARAGLPYPNPHSFRETHVTLGKEKSKSWAEMQA